MDTTFITIHDLTPEAHILYSSDSIVDILGHTPDEVVNRSVWEFFHPQELPLAKAKHGRGVRLDKAAVLSYCRIKNRQGDWVGCECCFSIVYDVMVCCTSIYRYGMQSQKRAVEAPIVRKLFASTPKDPRYHMLSHLSPKFELSHERQSHEPRAALFLNRFTRTLTIMYATSGIEQIIGISGDAMRGRSFYYCIAPNCLDDAVRCLESAKGNDSIAYLRFYFRDPRQDDDPFDTSASEAASESEDDIMTDVSASEIESEVDTDSAEPLTSNGTTTRSHSHQPYAQHNNGLPPSNPRTESGDSLHMEDSHRGIFGEPAAGRSSASSMSDSPRLGSSDEPIELEAVISCTSDGLVVCLRRARPLLPGLLPASPNSQYNGIYAAPWAPQPIFHPSPPQYPLFALGPRPPLMSEAAPSSQLQSTFMQSIREVAVFAWALAGINGSLVNYARGSPSGEAQPPDGVSVWNPLPNPKGLRKPSGPSGYASGGSSSGSNDPFGFGDPGLR